MIAMGQDEVEGGHESSADVAEVDVVVEESDGVEAAELVEHISEYTHKSVCIFLLQLFLRLSCLIEVGVVEVGMNV